MSIPSENNRTRRSTASPPSRRGIWNGVWNARRAQGRRWRETWGDSMDAMLLAWQKGADMTMFRCFYHDSSQAWRLHHHHHDHRHHHDRPPPPPPHHHHHLSASSSELVQQNLLCPSGPEVRRPRCFRPSWLRMRELPTCPQFHASGPYLNILNFSHVEHDDDLA